LSLLQELIEQVGQLAPEQRQVLAKEALEATEGLPWVPNPGPQTEAYYCQADELFYGGQAGGGKSDLLAGLSLTQHQRSLLLRRTNPEAAALVDRFEEIMGSRVGWNSQKNTWRLPGGKIVDIGGCQFEDDKQKYKGKPHDLIGFDEVSDFTKTQYLFITIWNRSADPEQRCRVVAAGNPPTKPEGLWVLEYWGPWLHPNHPNPAKPGDLRWFLTDDDGVSTEVDGPGPHPLKGEPVRARSRTFIRAKLSDNPDLAATNYDSVLAALPEELRDAYREGKFDVGLKDDAFQLIPTRWVQEAQQRWRASPPQGVPMCAMGVDVAGGGEDNNVLAPRYDGWFAPLVVVPGHKTPLGTEIAGLVVTHRRDNCKIVIDMGGGYGGVPYTTLRDNGIEPISHKGAEGSTARTREGKLGFYNKRSEVWYRFREALDPSQDGGSPIALPDDPGLVADLTAPHFEVGSRGIKVESKEKLIADLGRSPDKGDAVVMAWSEGERAITEGMAWRDHGARNIGAPQVVLSHQSKRRHLRRGR